MNEPIAKRVPKAIITASIFTCFDFQKHVNDPRERVSVVLAPIRLTNSEMEQSGDSCILIAWACSKAPHCANPNCRYAQYKQSFEVNLD